MPEKTHYDLIILGAGPAGMTAGVYAARKQLSTLILTENVGGQTTWSSGIENYLGFVYISGTELVQKFEEHLNQFEIRLEFLKCSKLSKRDGIFIVNTSDGSEFIASAVIIASGKSPRLLDVPGEKEYTGRGVTYCATCDAPLFSGMEVAVVGGGNSGLDAAVQLMKICPKVYLVEVGYKLRADEMVQRSVQAAENVEILTRTAVKEIRGNMFMDSILVQNLDTMEERELLVKGVFVEVGLVPNTDFVKELVALNIYGEIPVDCSARTGIPGLYAAGDCTTVEEKQIIIAAGDGAKAALGAYSYLVRLPAEESVDWGTTASRE